MLIDMPFAEYLANPAIGRSDVDNFAKMSPKKWRILKDNPPPPSSAMSFGSLVHSVILEPDTVDDIYALWPGKSRRGKEFEAFEASNFDKEIILPGELDKAHRLRDSFMSHDLASGLLANAEVEKTVLFDWDGIPCKARFDIVANGSIWDLKTTKDASPGAFSSSIRNYYTNQVGFYLKAAELSGLEVDAFNFIAIEKEPPYDLAIYTAGQDLIELGQSTVFPLLEKLSLCIEEDTWPGYPAEIIEVFK